VVISPSLAKMKSNDFQGRNLAILAGEEATISVMASLKQKLKARREP
jgi:NTE family protein